MSGSSSNSQGHFTVFLARPHVAVLTDIKESRKICEEGEYTVSVEDASGREKVFSLRRVHDFRPTRNGQITFEGELVPGGGFVTFSLCCDPFDDSRPGIGGYFSVR